MKVPRLNLQTEAHVIPKLRFETQTLTSFSGLVVIQQLFAPLQLKRRLPACFRGQKNTGSYKPATLFLPLIVHILLGYRELRQCQDYRGDPLVQRLLGLIANFEQELARS